MSTIKSLLYASCLAAVTVTAQDPNGKPRAYIYTDAVQYLSDSSNINNISLALVQAGLGRPNATDNATMSGFDWTKPFPGSPITGHAAHLRVAYDVPLPRDVVQDSTTTVTSLTFSIPDAMMKAPGTPKAMDPSWYVCRYFYVSNKPDPTAPVDHTCGFLGSQCLADLRAAMTSGWGSLEADYPGYMCAGLSFDATPASCDGKFGRARADIIGKFFSLLPPWNNSIHSKVQFRAQLTHFGRLRLYNHVGRHAGEGPGSGRAGGVQLARGHGLSRRGQPERLGGGAEQDVHDRRRLGVEQERRPGQQEDARG